MNDFGLDATIAGRAGPVTPNPATGRGLVTPTMLAKLRSVGYKGLTSDVQVWRKMPPQENPYGDGDEEWVNYGTYKGWMRQMNDPKLGMGVGEVSQVGIFRLHLEAAVEVFTDDKIVFEGAEYIVQNSNDDDTIRIFTTCYLRKIE